MALEAAPEEHRNWEWRHFHNQLDVARQAFGKPDPIVGATVSVHGRRVLQQIASLKGRVWDADSGKQLIEFDRPYSLEQRFSPNGRFFVHSTPKNFAVVWDVDANKVCAVLEGHDKFVGSLSFSRDSSRVLTGSEDGTARVWDPATGKQLQVFRGHRSDVGVLNLSRDGRSALSFDKGDLTCRVWDLQTANEICKLVGHERRLIHGQFSPKDDLILTIEEFPSNTMRFWDPTGKLLAVLKGHTNQVKNATFSPDGTTIATCGMDQTIRLWDVAGRKLKATLLGHSGWVGQVRFSPDGKYVLSASQDQTLRLWDAATGVSLATMHGHIGEVYTADFTADGKTIVSTARDGMVRLWDAQLMVSNRVLRGHEKFVYGVAFHKDGRRAVSGSWDGTVRLWDVSAGRQLSVMEHGKENVVNAVAFHPGGGLIASLSRDNTVGLWDVATSRKLNSLSIPSVNWPDPRLAFSPLGNVLAAGNNKGEIYLWQPMSIADPLEAWKTPAGPLVLKENSHGIRDLAFSSSGRVLAAAVDDGAILLWDLSAPGTPKLQRTLKGHTEAVYAIAFSADGKWLASGSIDGTVRLWDAEAWQEVAILKHGSNVYGLAFAPDGARLASACADHSIRLWDVARRQEVGELRGHESYVHSIAFSPDGTRLVSASGDATVARVGHAFRRGKGFARSGAVKIGWENEKLKPRMQNSKWKKGQSMDDRRAPFTGLSAKRFRPAVYGG